MENSMRSEIRSPVPGPVRSRHFRRLGSPESLLPGRHASPEFFKFPVSKGLRCASDASVIRPVSAVLLALALARPQLVAEKPKTAAVSSLQAAELVEFDSLAPRQQQVLQYALELRVDSH